MPTEPVNPINPPELQRLKQLPTEIGALFQAGIDYGQKAPDIIALPGAEGEPEGVPFAVIGGQLVSLHAHMPPRLGVLEPDFNDPASLISYLNKYKQVDTAIFAKFSPSGGRFTAIIDYPAPGKVTRREHVASFEVTATPAWAEWLAINGKQMNQDAFCKFIEKYRGIFQDPRGAEMLEMARYIEGRKEGQFKFGKRLQTGDREILWQEETQISAGVKGGEPTTIPEEIEVLMPMFEGSDPVTLTAWWRVYVNSGKVTFEFEIQNLNEIVRQSLDIIRFKIRDDVALPVYLGGANH